MTKGSKLNLLLATAAIGLLGWGAMPAAASAQERTISLPAMPLDQALQRIAAETGKPLNIDPDAVKHLTSHPVVDAHDERDAVRQATKGTNVAVQVEDDGTISILNDVVVLAKRDEAETSVVVRSTTTSSRLGQSLRDQPRNTQVITAKLLAEQQSQTLTEALANAGGVVVNSATVQGGVSFSVRGFSSNGAVNGLPTASSSSFAAGANEPLANIERIEVLKGPDAILLGGDNLGGTINIVTKKPSADSRLYVSLDGGSFGLFRETADINGPLTNDKHLTARFIATDAVADQNFGGYRGNQEYLIAPSLRYKTANTDIIVSAIRSSQLAGASPYTVLNPATKQPYATAFDQPLVGGQDQFNRIVTTQFNAELTQKLTDWATAVVRGEHQQASFSLAQYSPFVVLNPNGLLLLSASGVRQSADTNIADGYLRFKFDTGPFDHKIVTGFTYVDTAISAFNANNGGFFAYNFLNPTQPPQPLATSFSYANGSHTVQRGYYGQYLLGFWRLHLLAGVRRTDVDLTSTVVRFPTFHADTSATTPNYGAVLDITKKLTLFGTLAYGYIPTTVTDYAGRPLPDVRSRNSEVGIKWDLFDRRLLLTASYFDIMQSNRLLRDPAHPSYQIAAPGLEGKGVDINISGEPIRGLSLVAAYTRTDYNFLTYSQYVGSIVYAQPRDIYNFFASYRRKLGQRVTGSFAAGVHGNSSSSVDGFGTYYIPASVQADMNASVSVGALDFTAGVRNVFDRRNYAPTAASTYVPLGEPRNWRITLGYRFF